MSTLKLDESHFDDDNKYIGEVDVSNYDGDIEIQYGLGLVFFDRLKATGYIVAETCTGIESGESIESEKSIDTWWRIEAKRNIKARWNITTKSDIKAGCNIDAGVDIEAKGDIQARESIKAGYNIKVKGSIEARVIDTKGSIKAENGVKALIMKVGNSLGAF